MAKKPAAPTAEELMARYSPERTRQFLMGEITGKEYNQVSQAQMLKLAVMGFTQYEQGRYPEAQAIFEGLVFLDPAEPYYQIALGAVFLVQEELDLAEKSLTRAVDLKTTEVAAFVNRGEVYLRQGKIPEAAKDFKRAVQLDPQGKNPLTQRARMLASATLQMIKKAQTGAKVGPPTASPTPKPGEAPTSKPSAPQAKALPPKGPVKPATPAPKKK